MALQSLRIENFRAVREASLTFESSTVLFGENDCGISSIIEALVLILGPADRTFETYLRPLHFHRSQDAHSSPMRIRIRVVEDAPGDWSLPDSLNHAFRSRPDEKRTFDFEFCGSLDSASQRISYTSLIRPMERPDSPVVATSELLNWFRA